jgi:hypothetical protein
VNSVGGSQTGDGHHVVRTGVAQDGRPTAEAVLGEAALNNRTSDVVSAEVGRHYRASGQRSEFHSECSFHDVNRVADKDNLLSITVLSSL